MSLFSLRLDSDHERAVTLNLLEGRLKKITPVEVKTVSQDSLSIWSPNQTSCFHFTKIQAVSPSLDWTLWRLLQVSPTWISDGVTGHCRWWVNTSTLITHKAKITNLWLTILILLFWMVRQRTSNPVYNYQLVPPLYHHSPAPGDVWHRSVSY